MEHYPVDDFHPGEGGILQFHQTAGGRPAFPPFSGAIYRRETNTLNLGFHSIKSHALAVAEHVGWQAPKPLVQCVADDFLRRTAQER